MLRAKKTSIKFQPDSQHVTYKIEVVCMYCVIQSNNKHFYGLT